MKFKHLTINCQLFCYSIILLLFFVFPVKAQVTIGSQDPPKPFSVLELIAKEKDRGLRLPQLTTLEREALNSQLTGNDEAKGLVVFDTDLNCLEFWNGTEWISMCSDASVDCSSTVFPALNASYDFVSGATIDNLITAIGGNVKLYDAPIDGNLYDNPSTLLNPALTYYVEQRVSNCSRRVPVAVTISTAAVSGTALIDACVTAMYDIQYQTLTAYNAANAGTWQWYAKRRGENDSEYKPISGANSVSYKIPANFIKDVFRKMKSESGTNYNDSVVFQVKVSNAFKIVIPSDTLDIEFIDTYGNDYAELKAPDDIESNHNTGGVIKIAYLNLGVTKDENGYNACDFGSLYQWGRIKDGHEKTTWTKDADRDIAFDAATQDNQINVNDISTSDFNNAPTVSNLEGGDTTWQVLSDSPAYGEFIYGSNFSNNYSWNSYNANEDFWATSSYAKTSNDPCPSGWHVPTMYEIWAIFRGDMAGNGAPSSTDENKWTWRTDYEGDTWNSRIAGGYIVTYGDGSDKSRRIFIPAAGYRLYTDGMLYTAGNCGGYWGSTNYNSQRAQCLTFNSGSVVAGFSGASKAFGYSVRCVKE